MCSGFFVSKPALDGRLPLHQVTAVRVMILGLDCAPPALVFERYAGSLPHLSALREGGTWGPLRSSEPPITVPAWACMTSGRDPGELGLYGFRNRRRDRSYDLRVASSKDVRQKRLWERASDAGLRAASLFVPLTSPVTPIRGTMVSCFLSDGTKTFFPPNKAKSFEERFGPYQSDVSDFRSDELSRIFDELEAMRTQHFSMAKAVWVEEKPDFMMMVEMGPDRLHHAAWHHMDPSSPRYVAGNPWEEKARAYYSALDASVGDMLSVAGDACVMVVSDHGARSMVAGVALNDLLVQLGWLTLLREPNGVEPLRSCVDWSKTRAWAEGGYYARLFLNVEGREPQGVIPSSKQREAEDELAAALEDALSPRGIDVRAVRPREAYAETQGEPPDLMVYLGDLAYRALGTVGHSDVVVATNDTGPDGCNHDWNGIFIGAGPGLKPRGQIQGASLYDIAPTALGCLGLPHEDLRGSNLFHVNDEPAHNS